MDSKAIAQSAIEGSVYAAVGVGIAQMTKILSPIDGALFGVVAFVSGKVIAEGLHKFFGNTTSEKILKVAGEHFGGLLTALGAIVKLGYKMKLAASLSLGMWMIPLTYAVTKIALPAIMKQVS